MTWDGKEHRTLGANGESKMILEALKSMHEDNRENIKELYKRMDIIKDRVNLLPCLSHIEKFRRFEEHIEQGSKFRLALLPIFVSLLLTMIAGIITFTNVSQALDNHIEWGKENLHALQKEIEHRCI